LKCDHAFGTISAVAHSQGNKSDDEERSQTHVQVQVYDLAGLRSTNFLIFDAPKMARYQVEKDYSFADDDKLLSWP